MRHFFYSWFMRQHCLECDTGNNTSEQIDSANGEERTKSTEQTSGRHSLYILLMKVESERFSETYGKGKKSKEVH